MNLSESVSAKFPASAAVAALIAAIITYGFTDNLWSWSALIYFLIVWLTAAVIISFGWAALTSDK
ncbi:hypothetical protein [Corynebacterium sp.]|uniref:hypothetical protein n=1 Tax=Corynebacterium sp. TaxID=1720 RepID=UPI0026E0AF9B|nr:hypothetical protein [Corynebacterium sp.]MDO5511611.1 hypothetical protein [Corynebacterium sp.]